MSKILLSISLFAALPAILPLVANAQQPGQIQLNIAPANRTLTVSAEGNVSVDADVATLHIGFVTPPSDAKDAYATGAVTSNQIINAVRQAGVPESAIHSEWQRLDSVYGKPHKFTLTQQWTVKTTPERAAEILDVAITAGATSSGNIEWSVADEKALQDRALDQAAERAKAEAAALAKSMGVHLGELVYVTNQTSVFRPMPMAVRSMAMAATQDSAAPPPLAIEPHKVNGNANVYAVYAIE